MRDTRDMKKLTCLFNDTEGIYCPQKHGGAMQEQGLKACKTAFVRISLINSEAPEDLVAFFFL